MWTNLRLLAGPELVANIHVMISLIKSCNDAEHGQTSSGESNSMLEQLDVRATPDVNFFFEGFRQHMVATFVWATECKHFALGAPHIRRMWYSNMHLKMSFTSLANAPIIAITKATTKIYNYKITIIFWKCDNISVCIWETDAKHPLQFRVSTPSLFVLLCACSCVVQ